MAPTSSVALQFPVIQPSERLVLGAPQELSEQSCSLNTTALNRAVSLANSKADLPEPLRMSPLHAA